MQCRRAQLKTAAKLAGEGGIDTAFVRRPHSSRLKMDGLVYIFARGLIALLQALPLTWVARIGRVLGGLAYWLDGRHRRVALENLTMCFGGEKSPDDIRAIAKENFRRIGETYC